MRYRTYSEKTVTYVCVKMDEGRIRRDDELLNLLRKFQNEVDASICNREDAEMLKTYMSQVMDRYHQNDDRNGRKALRALKSRLEEIESSISHQ